MWRVIYCLKIALFRNQMLDLALVSEDKLNLICFLANFHALLYVQHWCTAPFMANAAVDDLELWEKLACIQKISSKHHGLLPPKFLELAQAAQNKFSNHLWYLIERNVGYLIERNVAFLFFSDKVTLKKKTEMWKKCKN